MKKVLCLSIILMLCSCTGKEKAVVYNNEEKQPLFSKLSSKESGVKFINRVVENNINNLISNFYIYNGAGVAVGDINNDGLIDIYFVSNQNEDKLYLNKGDLKFEDITVKARINNSTGWSSGVTMADLNNDGWLDIIVCKTSPAKTRELLQNKVYLNQKDNTFKESSNELGLNHLGFSVQSYLLDFDNDGDLDIYLLDHQMRNIVFGKNTSEKVKKEYMNKSNQLFRNDDGRFVNVTSLAFNEFNIYPSLSASIGDFNNDSWPDIYVCNDFLLPDELLINNQDGTFSNTILNSMNHISSNSMGSDFADINNDLFPDLIVLDMLADDHIRSKENMTSMNTKLFDSIIKIGYHKQYMSNVLQLNNGNGTYSEIGQLAGINKTDWSWGSLIADFDNDGYKDILVTNGIERDIDNRDFRNNYQKYIDNKTSLSLEKFHSLIPSTKQQNYIFKNNKDLSFKNVSNEWGLTAAVNSNGAVYADLDNDGDLDIVLNNINDECLIYENHSLNNFLKIKLEGSSKNKFAIGAKVIVYSKEKTQSNTVYKSRGFQSAVSSVLNFGLENETTVDSVKVIWNAQEVSTLKNIKANNLLKISYSEVEFTPNIKNQSSKKLLVEENLKPLGIHFKHIENEYNDYNLQLLLPHKQSTKGGTVVVGDVNKDGLDDFFIGNGKGSASSIYQQTTAGKFISTNAEILNADKNYKDVNALFFDVDNDADLDLYVASSSYESLGDKKLLKDRLYKNDGKGNFVKDKKALPDLNINTTVVKSIDIDGDSDLDLFVAGGVVSGEYPKSESSFILLNNDGVFKISKEFKQIGIVNDAEFTDFDNDGDKDLILVGDWMPITIFENEKGTFNRIELKSLEKSSGWWNTITAIDLDNDGNKDYLLGNLGNNNKFHPNEEKPLHIYALDFDKNGSLDIVLSKGYKNKLVPVRGLDCSSQQTPYITDKLKSFSAFANASITDIYGIENIDRALHKEAYNFNTSFLINKGNDQFELVAMPNECQFSPTLDFEVLDLNNDGNIDILGIGNYYDSEVETMSYDAGRGYVLLGNDKGGFEFYKNSGLDVNSNSRGLSNISIGGFEHLIIMSNNSELKLYKINK